MAKLALVSSNNNVFEAQTMTLKEITDLLNVRHDNAMRTVEQMIKDEAFGTAPQIEALFTANNGAQQKTKTYQLDKRQSIAVASRLNVSLLMRIIDRWQELESAISKKAVPQNYLEALEALVASEKEKLALAASNESLQIELDQSKQWLTIKRVAEHNGVHWKSFAWRRLKHASTVVDKPTRKIFDANYGEVNSYHADAWKIAYPEFNIPEVL